jgi:hypothetical protein
LILTIFIDILKFFERFNDVDVVPKVDNDVFRASMEEIVEDSETLAVDNELGYVLRTDALTRTLKTWRQFLPLSFSRLSNISIISTKSFLHM